VKSKSSGDTLIRSGGFARRRLGAIGHDPGEEAVPPDYLFGTVSAVLASGGKPSEVLRDRLVKARNDVHRGIPSNDAKDMSFMLMKAVDNPAIRRGLVALCGESVCSEIPTYLTKPTRRAIEKTQGWDVMSGDKATVESGMDVFHKVIVRDKTWTKEEVDTALVGAMGPLGKATG
jgi:hypothetical protein